MRTEYSNRVSWTNHGGIDDRYLKFYMKISALDSKRYQYLDILYVIYYTHDI